MTQAIRTLLSSFVVMIIGFAALADVKTEGITNIDLRNLKKFYPAAFDQIPSMEALDEVIRYLVGLETYSQIKVESQGDRDFVLSAIQLKKLGEITITGNKNVDTDEALNVLGFKPGMRFDSNKVYEAGERLKEFYGKKGYLNTIVSFNFAADAEGDLKVKVGIREREPCLISKINIKTTNVELKERVEKRIKKFLNKHFTEEVTIDIENLVREYLQDNRYLNSRFDQSVARYNSNRTGVTLHYELSNPYTYQIFMKGNDHISQSRILSDIRLNEMVQGSHDLTEDIALLVKNYYISKGYAQFKITASDKTDDTNFTKKLYYEIEEGPKVSIKTLEIVGRISRPSLYYARFITKNSSEQISDGIFVREDLEIGLRNLLTDLNNQGFLKAKVQSVRVDLNDKKTQATITIVLDEGPLTQLSKITFTGLTAFAESELLENLSIQPQSPLRLNKLEESITKLKQYYTERGYIEMKLLNEDETLVNYDDRGLTASVQFRVYEGPQVYVKSIVIEGNTFTKDYVIARELNIDVGDLVTPYALDEAQKRLDKLAIFSRINIKTLEENTDISQRTLVVTVTERNPGVFKIGAGISNKRELTARGFAGLSYNNIGGTARAVSLRGTLENNLRRKDRLEYETSISYLEPFLFNRRVRGRATYLHSEKITEGSPDGGVPDKLDAKDSISFNLEKDITSKVKFSWLAWAFDSNEQSDVTSVPAKRLSRLDIAYMGPTLDLEYRDNPFLPTEGLFAKLDTIYSSPDFGSSQLVQFVRSQGTISHYLPLGSSKWVWANSVSGGYEKNLNPRAQSAIPSSFAFFLGGVTTLRGYSGSVRDRVPNDTELPVPNSQLVVQKESTFQLYKSEIRFPIWGVLGGVVFFDAGRVDVTDAGRDFEIPFRKTYGFGIRINTPVGPIVLDYGKKINKLNYESSEAVHFSIGTF